MGITEQKMESTIWGARAKANTAARIPSGLPRGIGVMENSMGTTIKGLHGDIAAPSHPQI